jgi:hypothetical protein
MMNAAFMAGKADPMKIKRDILKSLSTMRASNTL